MTFSVNPDAVIRCVGTKHVEFRGLGIECSARDGIRIEGCGSATRFVHLDDSAPETEIYGNLCYRLGGGVSICGGAANQVHDNLFVECHWGVDVGPRGEDMFESDGAGGFRVTPDRFNWDSLVKRLTRYRWNEPPYSTKYPKLVEIFTKDPIAAPWYNVVERNVMVDCGYGIRKGPMKPEWSTDKKPAQRPSQAMVQTDDEHLYVRFHNDVDPNKGVSAGHDWEKDDAVEIAIAELGGEVGPVLILRGYPDGFWQAFASTGTSPSIVERLQNGGVQYGADVASRGLWTAEWEIPFAALGLEPQYRNPRLGFNLSVRKPADNELVMLKQTGGESWDATGGTLLWLAQFGEMAVPNLKPSDAVIHILSLTKTEKMLKAISGCEVCDWAQPEGHRLSANLRGMPTDSWQELAFSFVSTVDGDVSLILLGDGYTDPFTQAQLPVWVYMDDLRVEGAELLNGDIEERKANGELVAWRPHVNPAVLIHDRKLAASGSSLVKVAADRRFGQTLRLRAGQTVTVRAMVRGLPVQQAN